MTSFKTFLSYLKIPPVLVETTVSIQKPGLGFGLILNCFLPIGFFIQDPYFSLKAFSLAAPARGSVVSPDTRQAIRYTFIFHYKLNTVFNFLENNLWPVERWKQARKA